MLPCSQDSYASSASLAPFPTTAGRPGAGLGAAAAATPAPATPAGGVAAPLAPSPFQSCGSGGGSAHSSLAGAPGTPGDERLLMPLQHLLMSERAQQLTALEVKAIVFKARRWSVPCCREVHGAYGRRRLGGRDPRLNSNARRSRPVGTARCLAPARPPSSPGLNGLPPPRAPFPWLASRASDARPGRPPRRRRAAPPTSHRPPLCSPCFLSQVASDLADLHDAGLLHRHVTVASVALSRSGSLATARLLGHPFNVHAGQG